MSDRRDLVMAAMKTALEVASVDWHGEVTAKPTGLNVHRHLTRMVDQSDLPDITLYYAGETLSSALEGMTDESTRGMRMRLRCRAKAAAGESGDEALMPIIGWAEIATISDYTLGGNAAMTELELVDALTAREYAETYAEATLQFNVTVLTKWGDPRQAP